MPKDLLSFVMFEQERMRRCFVFVLGSSNRVCKEKRERENFDKEDISCDRFRNEMRRNEWVWLHHLHEKKRERERY